MAELGLVLLNNNVTNKNLSNGKMGPESAKKISKESTLNIHCIVCKRTGDLVMCSTCNDYFHPVCYANEVGDAFINSHHHLFCNKCKSIGEKFSSGNDWVYSMLMIHEYIVQKFSSSGLTVNKSFSHELERVLTRHLHSECVNGLTCSAPKKAEEIMKNFMEVFTEN